MAINSGDDWGTIRDQLNAIAEAASNFIADTVQQLLASTASTFGGAGAIIEAGGFRYEVVASGEHVTTAGGVKLRAVPFGPGKYHVAQIGAVGSGDESSIIKAFADALPAGSHLHFDGTKTYTVCVTTPNQIVFEVNGATLVNATNSDVILSISPNAGEITDHAVTESVLLPLITVSFTVVGASTLFEAGDIGTLWDNARRPSDNQPVNFETVKIRSVSGDTVTLEAPLESHKGAGAIIFRHSTRQIKHAGIRNAKVRPTASHTQTCLSVWWTDQPIADGNDVEGHTGHAVSIRHCYNLRIGDNRAWRPAATGSGQGYGVVGIACAGGTVGDTIADSCRHALDFDSTYRVTHGLVVDMNAISTPLTWRHNGFGGHIRGRGLIARMVVDGAYGVFDSNQGYGTGANRALAANHILRDCSLDFADIENNFSPNVFSIAAYFQNGADNVSIGVIRVRHLDAAALVVESPSIAVRLNGPVGLGGLKIGKIVADRIGRGFLRLDDNGFVGRQGLVTIDSTEIGQTVGRIAWIRGGGAVKIGAWFAAGNTGETLFEAGQIGSNTPDRMDVGPGEYDGTDTLVYAAVSGVEGEISPLMKSSGTALTSPNGATYTAAQIQNRSGLVRILGAVGSGTDAIASFPAPTFNGQVIRVLGKFSGRNNVSIPAASSDTGAAILFDTATPARALVGFSGLWVPLG